MRSVRHRSTAVCFVVVVVAVVVVVVVVVVATAAAADDDDDDDNAGDITGVPVEHPELGLEARRRYGVSGGAETRLHRSELPRAWLLHPHGQPLHDALLQNGR